MRPVSERASKPVDACKILVGRSDERLYCPPIGSCVVVALYDPRRRTGGLGHCLLPSSDGMPMDNDPALPGKYVSLAIPILVDRLKSAGSNPNDLIAKVAGGASVIQYEDKADQIKLGDRNVEAALATLKHLDIRVVGQDVGGNHGRSIMYDLATGDLKISSRTNGEKIL
jgi:chemotaxis protein CheD